MEKNKKKIKINKYNIYYLLILLASVFLFINKVEAASIYPSPSTGNYNISGTFSLGIFVSSSDQAMNAISGVLSFPSDKLEVTSISKSNSVINLWVQEPSFSNNSGTVDFEGIVLNPGYTGNAGRIITVNFRVKAVGTADITFSTGSVLANDGQGTNILEGLGSAKFFIQTPVTGPVAEQSSSPSSTAGTPIAPKIHSSTHEYPDAWYNINTPSFSWSLPDGVSSTRLLVGNNPQSTPTVVYTPAISGKVLDEMDDGTWYFHVQLRNSYGWGDVSHFKFQIDTNKPESLDVELQEEDDPTHPHRQFLLNAQDSGSGIDYYEIQIDNNQLYKWQDDGSHLYQTPTLKPGRHTIIIKAVDKAGNFITSVADFEINPLDKVIIEEHPTVITKDRPIIIKGKTYSNSKVIVSLQLESSEPQESVVNSDEKGNFTFIGDKKLEDGVYKVSATVLDNRGAYSESTDPITILVEPIKFWKIGSMAIDTLSILIPIMALIFSTIVLILFSLRKLRVIKKRLIEDVDEAHHVLQREMKFLKLQLNKHSKAMTKFKGKTRLTKADKEAMEVFRKDIIKAIKRVDKEIMDIKKDIK